jgi:hypothetical protein
MKLIIKRMKEDRSRVSRLRAIAREREKEERSKEEEKSCSGNSHSLIAKT